METRHETGGENRELPSRGTKKRAWLKRLEDAAGREIDVRRRVTDPQLPAETPVLRFRCTETARPYSFILAEESDGSFRVEAVVTDEATPGRKEGPGTSAARTEVSIEDVKGSQLYSCPYCGGRGGIVLCRCGALSCQGGGRLNDGEYVHKCPWCSNEAAPRGQIDTVQLDKVEAPPASRPELDTGSHPQDALRPPHDG